MLQHFDTQNQVTIKWNMIRTECMCTELFVLASIPIDLDWLGLDFGECVNFDYLKLYASNCALRESGNQSS